MNKQQVADWYMDKFADKTLSFGCIVLDKTWGISHRIAGIRRYDDESYNAYELTLSGKHRSCVLKKEGEYDVIGEIIGHPLTRGRFELSCANNISVLDRKKELYDKFIHLKNDFRIKLIVYSLLDKTIYERVENKEVLKLLISIKELYEKKGSNREDKSTMT